MKKKLLLLIFSFYHSVSFSQTIPNGSFENWNNFGRFALPDGWNSTDSVAAAKTGLHAASKNTFADDEEFSLMLMNVGSAQVVPGVICNCKMNFDSTSHFDGGISFTDTPDKLIAHIKYNPASDDEASIISVLFKRNELTNEKDTIAIAEYTCSGADSIYRTIEIPFSYLSSETPDSVAILITAGNNSNPQAGSILLIDKLEFANTQSGSRKSNPATIDENLIQVNPNPADADIHVNVTTSNNEDSYKIRITDLKNSVLLESKLNNGGNQFSSSGYANGNYHFTVYNQKYEIIKSGILTVIHTNKR